MGLPDGLNRGWHPLVASTFTNKFAEGCCWQASSTRRRLLLDSGRPVRLGSRALYILVALVERAGDVADKSELISLVWPTIFVDEANLRVHIAALRKALSEGQDGARHISPGVGKTTVALSVAEALKPHFDGRVYVADFAGIADPAECPSVLAAAFGLTREILSPSLRST